MLQTLIDGKEVSKCVIIEDKIDTSGRGLLKCFLHSLSNRYKPVHVVLYDISPSTFTKNLPSHIVSSLTIHDAHSNPHGWVNVKPSHHDVISIDTDLSGHLTQTSAAQSGDIAVVIDSLDQLILHRGAAYTCQILHRLTTRLAKDEDSNIRVVALVHGDLHDDVTMGLIRHTAISTVRLEQPRDTTNFNCAAQILHKRPSGKILKAHEQFTITNDLNIEDASPIIHITQMKDTDPTPDPTAGITFNLSLNEGEKAARSKLVLPYTRPAARKIESAVGDGSAKIFYQPDDADDFDEEDPDDDLDI